MKNSFKKKNFKQRSETPKMSPNSSLIRASLSLVLSTILIVASNATGIFNVMGYGAVADGKTDSTKALQNAWNEACATEVLPTAVVLVPEGAFLVGPLMFRGPCKSPMVMQVKGTVIATSDLSLFKRSEWIAFRYIDDLLVTGGGKFDGQGALAWPHNQCHKQKKCKKLLPTSINFSFVTNATIENISSVDSKLFHMHIFSSKDMKLQYLKISAPGDSPNTDGIHLGDSNNIEISNSIIGTGDDCISIGPGNNNINISGIFCGPGHGISVGSLGKTPGERDVIGLSVTNCTFTDTTNGVRIKTWQDSPATLLASDFTFNDIVMRNVENPIVIDQKYCPHNVCSQKSPSQVKISNIKFQNIRGDSRTRVAVSLLCSDSVPCQDVELNDIHLKYIGQGEEATAICTNVKGNTIGLMIPPSCL